MQWSTIPGSIQGPSQPPPQGKVDQEPGSIQESAQKEKEPIAHREPITRSVVQVSQSIPQEESLSQVAQSIAQKEPITRSVVQVSQWIPQEESLSQSIAQTVS